MKIGLFGGTFDPIHIGHLLIMENCINQVNLDKIFILPNSNPPHKIRENKSDSRIRVEMVKKAIKDNPKIELNDYDFRDNNIHYTFQTIEYFKKSYPNDQIYFIMGEDSFMDLSTWKNYKKILANYLIVFKRYSDDGKKIRKKIKSLKKYGDKIYLVDNMALDISSTMIRNFVKENKSIKYLVSKEVYEIIKKRNLYV